MTGGKFYNSSDLTSAVGITLSGNAKFVNEYVVNAHSLNLDNSTYYNHRMTSNGDVVSETSVSNHIALLSGASYINDAATASESLLILGGSSNTASNFYNYGSVEITTDNSGDVDENNDSVIDIYDDAAILIENGSYNNLVGYNGDASTLDITGDGVGASHIFLGSSIGSQLSTSFLNSGVVNVDLGNLYLNAASASLTNNDEMNFTNGNLIMNGTTSVVNNLVEMTFSEGNVQLIGANASFTNGYSGQAGATESGSGINNDISLKIGNSDSDSDSPNPTYGALVFNGAKGRFHNYAIVDIYGDISMEVSIVDTLADPALPFYYNHGITSVADGNIILTGGNSQIENTGSINIDGEFDDGNGVGVGVGDLSLEGEFASLFNSGTTSSLYMSYGNLVLGGTDSSFANVGTGSSLSITNGSILLSGGDSFIQNAGTITIDNSEMGSPPATALYLSGEGAYVSNLLGSTFSVTNGDVGLNYDNGTQGTATASSPARITNEGGFSIKDGDLNLGKNSRFENGTSLSSTSTLNIGDANSDGNMIFQDTNSSFINYGSVYLYGDMNFSADGSSRDNSSYTNHGTTTINDGNIYLTGLSSRFTNETDSNLYLYGSYDASSVDNSYTSDIILNGAEYQNGYTSDNSMGLINKEYIYIYYGNIFLETEGGIIETPGSEDSYYSAFLENEGDIYISKGDIVMSGNYSRISNSGDLDIHSGDIYLSGDNTVIDNLNQGGLSSSNLFITGENAKISNLGDLYISNSIDLSGSSAIIENTGILTVQGDFTVGSDSYFTMNEGSTLRGADLTVADVENFRFKTSAISRTIMELDNLTLNGSGARVDKLVLADADGTVDGIGSSLEITIEESLTLDGAELVLEAGGDIEIGILSVLNGGSISVSNSRNAQSDDLGLTLDTVYMTNGFELNGDYLKSQKVNLKINNLGMSEGGEFTLSEGDINIITNLLNGKLKNNSEFSVMTFSEGLTTAESSYFRNKGYAGILGDLIIDDSSEFINYGGTIKITGDANISTISGGDYYFDEYFTLKESDVFFENEADDYIKDYKHTITKTYSDYLNIDANSSLTLSRPDDDTVSENALLTLEHTTLNNEGVVDIQGDLVFQDLDDTKISNRLGAIYSPDGDYEGMSYPIIAVEGTLLVNEIENSGGLIMLENLGVDEGVILDGETSETTTLEILTSLKTEDLGTVLIGYDNSDVLEYGNLTKSLFDFRDYIGSELLNGDKQFTTGETFIEYSSNAKLIISDGLTIEVDNSQMFVNGYTTIESGGILELGDGDNDSYELYPQKSPFYGKDSYFYTKGLKIGLGSDLEINEDAYIYVDTANNLEAGDNDFVLEDNLNMDGVLHFNTTDINIADGFKIYGDGTVYFKDNKHTFDDKNYFAISAKVGSSNTNNARLDYIQSYSGSEDSDYSFTNDIETLISGYDNYLYLNTNTEETSETRTRERYFYNNSDLVVSEEGSLHINIGDFGLINNFTDSGNDYSTSDEDIIYLTSTDSEIDSSLKIENHSSLTTNGGLAVIGLGNVEIAGSLNVLKSQGLHLGTEENFFNNAGDDVWELGGEVINETDTHLIEEASNGIILKRTTGGINRSPVIKLGANEDITIPGDAGYTTTKSSINIAGLNGISNGAIGFTLDGYSQASIKNLNFSGVATYEDVITIINLALQEEGIALTASLGVGNKIKFTTEAGDSKRVALTSVDVDDTLGEVSLIRNYSDDEGVLGVDEGDSNFNVIYSGNEKTFEISTNVKVYNGSEVNEDLVDINSGSIGINYNGTNLLIDNLNFSGAVNETDIISTITASMANELINMGERISGTSWDSAVDDANGDGQRNAADPLVADFLDERGYILNCTVTTPPTACGTDTTTDYTQYDTNNDGVFNMSELVSVSVDSTTGELLFTTIIPTETSGSNDTFSFYDTSDGTATGVSLIKNASISLGELGETADPDIIGSGDVVEDEDVAGVIHTTAELTSFAEITMDYDSTILVGTLSDTNYDLSSATTLFNDLKDGNVSFAGDEVDAYFANDVYEETRWSIVNGAPANEKTVEKGGIRVDYGGIFVSGNLYNSYELDEDGEITYQGSNLFIGDGAKEDDGADAFLYVNKNFIQESAESQLVIKGDGEVFIGGDMILDQGDFLINNGGVVSISGNLSFGDSDDSQIFTNDGTINFIGGADEDDITTISGVPSFEGTGLYNFTKSESSTANQGYFAITLDNSGGINNGNLSFDEANMLWTISGDDTLKFENNGDLTIDENSTIKYIFKDENGNNSEGHLALTMSDTSTFYLETGSSLEIGEFSYIEIDDDNYLTEDIDGDGNLDVEEDSNNNNRIDLATGTGRLDIGLGDATIRGTLIANSTSGRTYFGGTIDDITSTNNVSISGGVLAIKNSLRSEVNLSIDRGGEFYIGYDMSINNDNLAHHQTGRDRKLYYNTPLTAEISNSVEIEEGSIYINGNLVNGVSRKYYDSYFNIGDEDNQSLYNSDAFLYVGGNFTQASINSSLTIYSDGEMTVEGNMDLLSGSFEIKTDGLLTLGGGMILDASETNFTNETESNIILTGDSYTAPNQSDQLSFDEKAQIREAKSNRISFSEMKEFNGNWNFKSEEEGTSYYEITTEESDITFGETEVKIGTDSTKNYDVLIDAGSENVNIEATAKLTIESGSSLEVMETTNNSGTITNKGLLTLENLNNFNSISNYGTINITEDFINNSGSFSNDSYVGIINFHGNLENRRPQSIYNDGEINMYGGSSENTATQIIGDEDLYGFWSIMDGYVEATGEIDILTDAVLSLGVNSTFITDAGFEINGTLNMNGGDLILNGENFSSTEFNLEALGYTAGSGETTTIEFSYNDGSEGAKVSEDKTVGESLIFDTDMTSTLEFTNAASEISNLIELTKDDTLNITTSSTSSQTTTFLDSSKVNLRESSSLTTDGTIDNEGTLSIGKNATIDASEFTNSGDISIFYDNNTNQASIKTSGDITFEQRDITDEDGNTTQENSKLDLSLDDSMVEGRGEKILIATSTSGTIDSTALDAESNVSNKYYLIDLVDYQSTGISTSTTPTELAYMLEVNTDEMVNSSLSNNANQFGEFFKGIEEDYVASGTIEEWQNKIITGIIRSESIEDLSLNYETLGLRIMSSMEQIASNNTSLIRDAILSNNDIYSTITIPMSYLSKNSDYYKEGLYKFGNPWGGIITNTYNGSTDKESIGYEADFAINTTGGVVGYDWSTYGRKGDLFKMSKYGLSGSVLTNTASEEFSNNLSSYELDNMTIGTSAYYSYLSSNFAFKTIGSFSSHSGSYDRIVKIGDGFETVSGDISGTTMQAYLEAGIPFKNISPFVYTDFRSNSFGGYSEKTNTGAELEVGDTSYTDTILGAGISVYESFKGSSTAYDTLNLTASVKYGTNTSSDANEYSTSFLEDSTNTEFLLDGNYRAGSILNTQLSADFIKDNLNYKLQYQFDKDDLGSGSTFMLKLMLLN